MNYGKLVLIFQAFVTLILGAIFLYQLFHSTVSQIIPEKDTKIEDYLSQDHTTDLLELQKKFIIAGWVLITVALIEMVLISRL